MRYKVYCFRLSDACSSQYTSKVSCGQPGNAHGFFGLLGTAIPPFEHKKRPADCSVDLINLSVFPIIILPHS